MSDTAHITTAEQLLEAGDIGRCELIRGQLHMMTPAGDEHGRTSVLLIIRLGAWVEQQGLGTVYGPDNGFVVERDPDTVLVPDVAFISAARAPRRQQGFTHVIPDLVVETTSPTDRAKDVIAKVRMWLEAGVKQAWVIDPRARTVQICRPDGSLKQLNDDQMLDGGDIVPGFSMRVADLFNRN